MFVSGTIAAGKTTVAEAASGLLTDAGIPHGVIDLDWLCQAYPAPPGDPFNDELAFENLAVVWPHYAARGIRRLVVARVIESPRWRARAEASLPEVTVAVARILASVSTRYAAYRTARARPALVGPVPGADGGARGPSRPRRRRRPADRQRRTTAACGGGGHAREGGLARRGAARYPVAKYGTSRRSVAERPTGLDGGGNANLQATTYRTCVPCRRDQAGFVEGAKRPVSWTFLCFSPGVRRWRS